MMTMRRTLACTGIFVLAAGCGAQAPGEEPTAREATVETTTQALAIPAGHGHSCGDHEDEDSQEAREHAAIPVSWNKKKAKQKIVQAKILGFNDFHGQLSEGRLVGGRPVGGAAVLASYLETAAAGFEGRSLVIHAGDHVGASPPESALLQDEPSIQFLNLLADDDCRGAKDALRDPRRGKDDKGCNVVGTLGNHEFDEGKDELFRLLYGGNHANGPYLQSPWRGAKFPYVNANVVSGPKQKPILPPYVIRKLDKVEVAVIGAVLKETPTIVTPAGVAGLSFLAEAQAINAQVKELKCKGIRTVIVSIHQGSSQASYTGSTDPNVTLGGAIAPIVSALDDEIDVVISGHSHSFSNALVENANGHEILVTQAFSSSTAYDEIDLEIDVKTGDVVSKSAKIVTTYSDVAPGNVRDADVKALVDSAVALTAPLVNQVVGSFTASITRTQSSAGESTLGNLIADAQRAALGTDFAFMNPGGIRQDLLFAKSASNPADADGLALWGELFTIQPFGNSLVRLEVTGQQIYDLLNQQFTVNRFLQVSGLEYTWDNSLPAASRVVEVRKDGVALDKAATYSVTANNFIATGGDGFTVFLSAANPIGGPIDLDAFIDYIEALPQPFGPPALGRIARLN
jgi:5'-nucleotidase